jgi:hypothetical protein
MRGRDLAPENDSPGPGYYKSELCTDSVRESPPKYKMSLSPKFPDIKASPGPGDYKLES